ncbi:hypothetical protein FA95DRAFT_1612955 [Auriscalpium vulgare]|uniref:Uncharacterized protein n=1 Tax=Auriscalpium vulgare TaxID=40419 RepID=A0ACB8R5S7_9AGAM|nr:hypothetical protein FA95DRAFT_1612955 [Auriscalpium vulgare]
MPNTLSHLVLDLGVAFDDLITVDILLLPNGTLYLSWHRAGVEDSPEQLTGAIPPPPSLAEMLSKAPAGGPPVVRTLNLAVTMPGDANRPSRVKWDEDVRLVQGVEEVLRNASA